MKPKALPWAVLVRAFSAQGEPGWERNEFRDPLGVWFHGLILRGIFIRQCRLMRVIVQPLVVRRGPSGLVIKDATLYAKRDA
ncbi:MAG: hypothetical protein JWR19_2904 [Pedosphaera sp.]|nr:hypothetical protein [Pedosphaera sp.]